MKWSVSAEEINRCADKVLAYAIGQAYGLDDAKTKKIKQNDGQSFAKDKR